MREQLLLLQIALLVEPKDGLYQDRPEVVEIKRLLEQDRRKRLADYHQVGEQMRLLYKDKKVTAPESGWKAKVAEMTDVSRSLLDKCLQLRNTSSG